MAQTADFDLDDGRLFQDIRIFAGEALHLEVRNRDPETSLILTIGLDNALPPLIQMTGTDRFELTSSVLAVLPEGRTCLYNLWQQGATDPILVKRGSFLARASLQPVGLPVMLTAPEITGAPLVGSLLTLSSGVWQDADAVTWDWLRNGQITGTSGSATYSLTDADDGQTLGARVTATNANGSVTQTTSDLSIRRSAPDLMSALPDLTLTLGQSQTTDLSGAFSGDALIFSLAPGSDPLPAGLTLGAQGALSGVPTAVSQAALVLRASNSGGHVDGAFALTIGAPQALHTTLPRLILMGDSIMAFRPGTGDWTERYLGDQVYLPDGFMQAVAGSSSQDMLDLMPQILAQVVADDTIVLVGPIGENRETGASSFEEITADIDSIYTQLTGAGATVVAVPTLPETNEHSAADLKLQLADYVRGYAGVHVVDIGQRDPVSLTYDPAQSYDPYSHTNDQSHPNGEGARFLSGRIRAVVRPLIAASVFDASNLLGAFAGFPGAVASAAAGVQGTLPDGWQAQRTGAADWTVGKTPQGAVEITITSATEASILTLTLPSVAVTGAPGDVLDNVVEAEVAPGGSGLRGLQVVQIRQSEDNATSQLPPVTAQPLPDHKIYLRTRGKPCVAAQTALDYQIKVFVEAGATVTVTLLRATLVLADQLAQPLAISGAPMGNATTGAAYSFVPVLSGGTPPYMVSLLSGSLPPGLGLDPATGAVSGTPTLVGVYPGLVLRVTDANGSTADLPAFDLTVAQGAVPQNTQLPVLDTTTPQVGDTLTTSPGQWTNAPDSHSYQWLADGAPISGATQISLAVTAAHLGAALSVQVTAANGAGAGTPALSQASDPVVSGGGAIAALDPSFNIGSPPQMAYSDQDRVVAATTDINGLRSTRGATALTGKTYFEVAIGAEINTIGVCNQTSTVSNAGAVGTARAGWAGILFLHAGTNINMGAGFGPGDVVQVAVDMTGAAIWMRLNGSGLWNNTSGADPATGVGGVDIAGLGATIFPHIQLKNNATAQASFNATADRLTLSAPSGFAPVL